MVNSMEILAPLPTLSPSFKHQAPSAFSPPGECHPFHFLLIMLFPPSLFLSLAARLNYSFFHLCILAAFETPQPFAFQVWPILHRSHCCFAYDFRVLFLFILHFWSLSTSQDPLRWPFVQCSPFSDLYRILISRGLGYPTSPMAPCLS